MTARSTLFATLRRSLLGAWLACAYALAVLAAGLAPSQAMAETGGLAQSHLCSGQPIPAAELPGGPVQDEPGHCKGCVGHWPAAVPPGAMRYEPFRPVVAWAETADPAASVRSAAPFGLQPSRGPPQG